MPLFLNEKKSVLFLHIPKTGGTTVESWLTSTNCFKSQLFYEKKLEDIMVTPQHFGYETASKLIGDFDDSELYKFAIVRNPFDRLVSEFFYRLKLHHLYFGKSPERFFSCWVIHVLNQAKKKPSILDNHLRPQTYFTSSDVDIFKFENGFKTILTEVAKTICVDPPKVIDSHKVGVKKEVYWSSTAVDLVKNYYASDFENFNYDNQKTSDNKQSSILTKFIFSCFLLRMRLSYIFRKFIEK
ncbi:sulfotransferase family 2 domain-containing protein [Alteromonas stellipolaris]|uniref:sulfotransferase family 2 domain-containing protein n=1 Tax=Alteromonas stellipolaris TaxID=233316 RepID=UPI002733578E|nr:sulfotransferase family 2 domain-containing protein [Alteromonas stellipolaris]MDP2537248.1 sulfotransferase family 2 domain-containing protein [Alteromonas stellipolaris]